MGQENQIQWELQWEHMLWEQVQLFVVFYFFDLY
jgi:hypothetical protein